MEFAGGLKDGYLSSIILGYDPHYVPTDSTAYNFGRPVGDVAAGILGIAEIVGGSGLGGGGLAACGTGVLCPAGAPSIAGGAALAGYGYGTLKTASEAFGKDLGVLFSSNGEGPLKSKNEDLNNQQGAGNDLTKPSLDPSPTNFPGGKSTEINPNEAPENIRALARENESPITLAQNGYSTIHNPTADELTNIGFSKAGGKKPDFIIEGKVFDNIAPSTGSARNISSRIIEKIDEKQTERIILNLDDSEVSLDKLKEQLTNFPIDGLKELIIIKKGEITPFFP
jgi:Contact-dependent growth inhibition CdiA C-terminal domain